MLVRHATTCDGLGRPLNDCANFSTACCSHLLRYPQRGREPAGLIADVRSCGGGGASRPGRLGGCECRRGWTAGISKPVSRLCRLLEGAHQCQDNLLALHG